MEQLLQTIKERKEDRVAQALLMLDTIKAQEQTEEDKRHLLSIAARNLDDVQVAKKWVYLLTTEENTITKELLIACLPYINLRTIQSIDNFTNTVLASFATPTHSTKVILTKILFQLIKIKPEISENIVALLKKEQNVHLKNQLAEALADSNIIAKESTGLYKSILVYLKEEQQFLLFKKLVRTNNLTEETILKYLQPTTTFPTKLLLLNYLNNRKIVPIKELQDLLLKEGNEYIKEQILKIFANDTKNIDQHLNFLKKYINHEKEPEIRQKATNFLYKNIAMTNEMILFYTDLLQTENEVSNTLNIATMLAPYIAQEPLETSNIKKTFLTFLENTQATYHLALIQYICKQLNKHIIIDDTLFERMLLIYHKNEDLKIKQEMLYAFCASLKSDHRLIPIYVDAIKSPSPLIREYACLGLLPLPLTQKNIPHLLATIPLLLDNNIRETVREIIALRIIATPDKSPELIEQLKNIAKNGLGKIKVICEKGYEKALQTQNINDQAGQVDWQLWENRIKVEKRVDHIFPEILIYYEDNTVMAKELLKTILIDSNCANSLYSATHITKRDIVRFLIAKDHIDQEIALFCFDQLENLARNKEDNIFLVALNNYKNIALLKEKFWVFFEKNLFNPASFLNVLLLRNVMSNAYGSEAILAEEFANRLFNFTNAKAATPYLEFLFMSLDWQYTDKMIDKLLAKPQLVDKSIKSEFDAFIAKLSKEIPFDLDATPGFAD